VFRALPEKMAASDPAETAVICQETVLEPPEYKLPTLTEGALTEKCPLCELRLAETLDKTLYSGLLTVFPITAVTVAVCPTFNVAGTWLAVMVRVWL
jgi:hypothetical protein